MNKLKLILTSFLATLVFYSSSYSQSDTTLIRIGKAQYEAGKYKKALKTFIKATVVNPKSALAFRLVGETYFRIVKLDESISAYEKSITLDSTDNKTLLDLGIAKSRYFFKDKNKIYLDQSDTIYNKIISKNYEVPYTYMLIAYNYAYRQDFENCWKYIYKVKEIDERYVNKRFVLDLYIEHPDPENVFNIQTGKWK
jgi:tetratricopeptide (TPR) repeat protein